MTTIPLPDHLDPQGIHRRLRTLAREVEDLADELEAIGHDRDAHIAVEAVKATATSTIQATAEALVGSGDLVPANLLAQAAQAGADATVRYLHEAGLLIVPGEVRDVRVVEMPPTRTIAQVVRDRGGRIIALEMTMVPE